MKFPSTLRVVVPLHLSRAFLFLVFALLSITAWGQSFTSGQLDYNGLSAVDNGTALEFGPDGKLYVAEENGLVKVYTIQRNGLADYIATGVEVLNLVQSIPNHDDDDGGPGGPGNRQVTGLTTAGTAASPIVYVSSSDRRRGAGGGGGDANLDTNSGVITKLQKNGGTWEAIDIVRGLPRSEENHATNGMQVVTVGGTEWLIVCSGGFTNAGAPSNNFAYITEYALSGAVLAVDLSTINSLPVLNDGSRNYVYDLPTLDDPTRPNVDVNGNPASSDPDDPNYSPIDVNDPWGGNDGLNMAMLVPNSPVKMFSPGYRNTYDLVITTDGHVYVTDNGANGGWGGYPEYEGDASLVNNNYRSSEPGSNGSDGPPNSSPYDGQVNNSDHLDLVTTDVQNYVFGSVYGGHPCPVRANVNAGLFTRGSHSPGGAGQAFNDSYFRTQKYDPDGSTPNSETDPMKALPANWPPVDPSLINPDNADFRQPSLSGNANPDGPEDIIVVNWGNNTNAIAEYTASNFNGDMQGDLIAGKGGSLHRVDRDPNTGNILNVEQNKWSVSGNPLGLDCQGDGDIFPGTIWVANYSGDDIIVLEPNDFIICVLPGDPGYDPNGDNDGDGYTNDDEVQNGTDLCSGASQPRDFDGDLVSDLLDLDDDGDGINDAADPLQMGQPFDLPVENELFLGTNLGGYLGLGFTGLMNNGDPNPNYLNWQDDPDASTTDTDDILGGAIGAVTMYQTAGDASTNDQEKAYQYGVNVDNGTGAFTVHGRMFPPFHNFSATESQGLFIGDGFQDDYVKLVLGQNYELTIVGENNGSPVTYLTATSIGFSPSPTTNNLDLLLEIDPATGLVQAKYAIDNGPVTNVGAPFQLLAGTDVLNAVQSSTQALMVGIIGTADADDDFAANWDFLNVRGTKPFVTQDLPDLDRFINDPNDVLGLDSYFGDDNGPANLTFTVAGNTNPAIGASISGNNLTLTYPAVPASSDITIRATDADANFAEQTFSVDVTDEPAVLFRVNAGGGQLAATGGDPNQVNWEANTGGGAQTGNGFSVNAGNTSGFTITNFHSSVPGYAPTALFQSERWDPGDAPEMLWSFNTGDGTYTVNLFMADGWNGTSNPGDRVFDILMEGVLVADNKDIIAEYGDQLGVMESYLVTVTDGTLDIEFLHVTQNPLINGIEILGAAPSGGPITISAVADQVNLLGDTPTLSIVPSGGDPNETFSFSASGLPPGLSIEPTNGAILGTISTDPADAGIYNVTVTVDKPSSTAVDESFSWTINDPALSTASAEVRVLPGNTNIDASTYSNGSFQIENTSPTAKITSVTFETGDGFIPNIVFDPNGTAGDPVGKPFTVNSNPGVGTINHMLSAPLGNGGYQTLQVTFTDFDPGETLTFSIDQDPTSVEGLPAPGPNEAGSVSGLEQSGSTVTVTFDDGTSIVGALYSDGSNAGAIANFNTSLPPAPSLAIQGLSSPAITGTPGHTLLVSGGPANGSVSLLQVEAGFFETSSGAQNQEAFEVNSVVSVNRSTNIPLDAAGTASIPITLVATDPQAGYNYFLVAAESGSIFGPTSDPVIMYLGNSFPVSWLGLEATDSDAGVALRWETAQEQNNDYFEVQRRVEHGEFASLGTVDGAGNSDVALAYRYLDASAPQGRLYYRLRQVDMDGSFSFSPVVEVYRSGSGFVIYPNPVRQQLTVVVPETMWPGGTYRLYDLRGKLLAQERFVQRQELQISVAPYPEGWYLLELTGLDGQRLTQRLQKE